jgi:hypothetical protein
MFDLIARRWRVLGLRGLAASGAPFHGRRGQIVAQDGASIATAEATVAIPSSWRPRTDT